MSCESFLNFIRRYDTQTTKQIIKEALMPDISDVQDPKQWPGSRRAMKSAIECWDSNGTEPSLR